jgi:hypothetical protein
MGTKVALRYPALEGLADSSRRRPRKRRPGPPASSLRSMRNTGPNLRGAFLCSMASCCFGRSVRVQQRGRPDVRGDVRRKLSPLTRNAASFSCCSANCQSASRGPLLASCRGSPRCSNRGVMLQEEDTAKTGFPTEFDPPPKSPGRRGGRCAQLGKRANYSTQNSAKIAPPFPEDNYPP